MNDENDFLEKLLDKQIIIFLINGIRLEGELTKIYESGDLLLSRGNETQLVRCHVQGTIFKNEQ